MEDGPPGENLTRWLGRETKDWIVQKGAEPFFAMLSFYAVHAPVQSTQQQWRHYRDKAVARGVADTGFVMERRLPIRTVQDHPVYGGLVESMDAAVGEVLDALDSLGIADNTIVFFTSDNGGVASGDAYATSNLPLRGGKGYQWEGGIREPFFLRAGDRFASKDVDIPVHGVDVYPTLLDLAGVSLPAAEQVEGISLLPLMEGDSVTERALYWHYPHYGNQGGDPSGVIRRGEWKLIHYYEDERDELYNLADDPGEQRDLAAAEPERTKRMRDELMAYLNSRNAGFPYPDVELDPADRAEKMRWWREVKLPELVAEREAMFGEGWRPNEDWWGSE
jgi:hypothetical protein